jgi:hypothetical protein
LLSVIGFPHAEHVAIRATRGVAHDDHAISEHAEADDPRLTVALAQVLDLDVRPVEDNLGILEIESAAFKVCTAPVRVVSDGRAVSVATSTSRRNVLMAGGA